MEPLLHERAFQTSPDDFLDIATDEWSDPNASRFNGRQERRGNCAANHRMRPDLL
jgi:hypothetical protein